MCNVDGERPYAPTVLPGPGPVPAPVLARRSPAFIPRPQVGFPGYVNPGVRRYFVPQPVLSQSYVAPNRGFVNPGVPTVTKVVGGAPGFIGY